MNVRPNINVSHILYFLRSSTKNIHVGQQNVPVFHSFFFQNVLKKALILWFFRHVGICRWRWQQRRLGMSDPVLRNFQGKWRHQFSFPLSWILVMWNPASLCQTIHLDFLFGASGVYTGNSQGPSGDRHREICLKKTGYKSLFFRWANIAFY